MFQERNHQGVKKGTLRTGGDRVSLACGLLNLVGIYAGGIPQRNGLVNYLYIHVAYGVLERNLKYIYLF